jgi:iron complex outermembrane recepter protein
MPIPFNKAPLVAAIALATATSLSQAQMLEEVIVTAQKRAESLQDVPISVTAMQGDKLQDAGIANMSALADYVPNLHIADAAVNTNIYMRGMGSGNNQAFEQSVGMYIDGIYMGRGRQYRSPFVDVERVEVLRGPQGTLFGKNTVAGAINVTTASPEGGEEFNGDIAVSVEENGGLITEGYISGSLTDTFALRLGGKYRETDGFMENEFLGEDEGGLEETMFRITAVWQPTDNLDINLKYSYTDYDKIGSPSTTKTYLSPEERAAQFDNLSANAQIAYAAVDFFYDADGEFSNATGKEFVTYKDNNLGPDPVKGRALIGINPDSTENETDNIALKVDWAFAGDYTLTAITGWSSYESLDGVDVDWLPLQFISRDDDQEFSQFSQEFRITSPGGEFFDYVAGVYYEESDLEFDRRVVQDLALGGLLSDLPANRVLPLPLPDEVTLGVLGIDSLFTFVSGGALNAAQGARDHYYQLDSDSWAVFGQGTFNITDSFRVTVGLRYTEETKEVESTQFLSESDTGIGIPSQNTFLPVYWSSSLNTYNYDYNEKRDTDALLPALNLQWDVFDDTMLYVSLSQGFKSGGFTSADDGQPGGFLKGEVPDPPLSIATEPSDEFEFDDEEVDAFELGGKHTLLDGGMTLNWAYFYTDYTDLQVSVFKGIGFTVTNATATVQGLEVDMMWQATDSLRIGASGGWLDAEFDDFADAPCTTLQLDVDPLCGVPGGFTDNNLSGQETTYAPEYSATVFFDFVTDMGDSMEFFAGGEANYKDDYSPAGDNDPEDRIDSYTKVNLRFGLRGDNWEVMAYGRNIFDEEVFVQSADVPLLSGSHYSYGDEGAVFGARAKYSF